MSKMEQEFAVILTKRVTQKTYSSRNIAAYYSFEKKFTIAATIGDNFSYSLEYCSTEYYWSNQCARDLHVLCFLFSYSSLYLSLSLYLLFIFQPLYIHAVVWVRSVVRCPLCLFVQAQKPHRLFHRLLYFHQLFVL